MYMIRWDGPGGDGRPRLVSVRKPGGVVSPLAILPDFTLMTPRFGFGILNPKLLVLPNLQRPVFAGDVLHALGAEFRALLRTPAPHTKLGCFGFGTAGLGVLGVGFERSFTGVETPEIEGTAEERPAAGDVCHQDGGGCFTDIPKYPIGRVRVGEGVVFVEDRGEYLGFC